MAKNFRRMFAMVLVMCMIFSALPMQALAAEEDAPFTETDTVSGGEVVITITPSESNSGESSVVVSGTNESGSTVDLTGTSTTTSSSTTDSAGNVTDSSSTHVVLEGTETPTDGSVEGGIHVNYEDTTTKTTVTDAEGNPVSEKEVTSGSETKEWDEKDSGNEANQPKVEVVLKPGDTVTETATTTVITGDKKQGEDDTEYDYTETTTTERTVEVTAGEITPEIVVGDVTMNPVAPELWERRESEFVLGYYANGDRKTNIYEDDDDIHYSYALKWDSESQKWVPSNWNNEVDGDYRFDGYGEQTTIWVEQYENIEYKVDEAGNIIMDSYYEDSSRPTQFVLHDKDGNMVFAYCVDLETGAVENSYYNVSNLEDSDYYTSEEAEAHIRAIVSNGYWGVGNTADADGNYKTGSLAKIKDNLKKAFADGVLEDEDVVITGDNGEETIKLSELMQGLTEGEALAVTQAAIWTFANGSKDVLTGEAEDVVVGADGFSGGNATRLATLYNYLISLTEENQTESTVIDDTSFLKEDGLSLVIGDKVAEAGDEVEGETLANDVYDVGLNFKLAFAVNDEDELYVYLVDSENNPIKDNEGNAIIKHLLPAGSDAKEGSILPGEDGSYTLTGLRLAENSDFTFDLKLEGTQHLEQGVYVYSPVGGRDSSQTLIGMGEGTREVDVTTSLTVSFSVDESNHVVAERVWCNEYDPNRTPAEKPENPNTPRIGEPPQIFRLNNQDNLVEIPEEPVPLAAPVITGDNSGLWIAVILFALCGIVAVNIFDKKRQHESF